MNKLLVLLVGSVVCLGSTAVGQSSTYNPAVNPSQTCNGKAGTIFGDSNDGDPTTMDNSVTGTNGNDVFIGTDGTDQFFGLAGNDTACFYGQSDDAYMFEGDDWVNMGDANDSAEMMSGDDVAYMGNSHNWQQQADYPGPPEWAKWLTWGDIACMGGSDCNSTSVGTDHDVFHGGEGPEAGVSMGPGNDLYYGDDGRDFGAGQQGNDEMHGNKGNDALFGGQDFDRGFGGADFDQCDGFEQQQDCEQ
jgi:Ca2+-binding RTX toxin-like protein